MIAVYAYLGALGLEWLALAAAGILWWRWPVRYAVLFASIQCAAGFGSPLWIAGVIVCAVLAYTDASTLDHKTGLWHWPRWAWLFDNAEDGVDPHWYEVANPTWSKAWREFRWTALRNSVNNFRYVRGVSGAGRPLYRKTFGSTPGGWYVAFGWNASGYPVLSGGKNVNSY